MEAASENDQFSGFNQEKTWDVITNRKEFVVQ